MDGPLLEREAELAVLAAAAEAASEGRGSAVLLHGEAGIGKTRLVRAFLTSLDDGFRVLAGACDDLLTPRAFGPLRDATAGHDGPLARALAEGGDREDVYQALRTELAPRSRPTVLVVEDLHWADDATLDAVRFVVRRLPSLGAAVVLTFRDDDLSDGHPLRRLLGSLAVEPVTRLRLAPLSIDAVAALSTEGAADEVYATTRGNPFFVTEVLSCHEQQVPATVVDAVMARVRRLPAPTRAALEALAVVPSRVDPMLVKQLVGDVSVLAEAERRQLLEVSAAGVAFRHELARRAVMRGVPRSRLAVLHHDVLVALLSQDPLDLARVVHHAVAAGDVDLVVRYGPAAARGAARAGSHRQALGHLEQVAVHLTTIPPRDQAAVLVDLAWELYAAQRWDEAVARAHQAVQTWTEVGDDAAAGRAMVVLSRSLFMADRPAEALRAVEQALVRLEPTGDTGSLAYAETYLGTVLALTDRQTEALPRLQHARELAAEADRVDLVALCTNYIGCARIDLGDEAAGLLDLRESLRLALAVPHFEYAARAYTNLAESTYRLLHLDDLEGWIDEGLAFVLDHDLPGHRYNLEAHRAMLLMRRGHWDEALRRLTGLVEPGSDPGQLSRLTVPTLGRLLARRGEDGADAVIGRAWTSALRNGSLAALAPAGLAAVEAAWLAGDLHRADDAVALLLDRTAGPAGADVRGELLRYLARAGEPAETFPGCPAVWEAGLAGSWREAADLWGKTGDPYERALELADSGSGPAALEALEVLDRLGAVAAARLVRGRLRELGVTHVPRGRTRASLANPAGLTERQVDVLALLAAGLTNAQIAADLVVSTRTVDHHVSAILTRLEVSTRRDAARRAVELGLTTQPPGLGTPV